MKTKDNKKKEMKQKQTKVSSENKSEKRTYKRKSTKKEKPVESIMEIKSKEKEVVVPENEKKVSIGQQIINKMKRGVVSFTFINRSGKEITTKGTLLKKKIPTTRKVAGAVKPKSPEMVVFYDTRHGIRRQFDRNKVVGFA